MLAYEIGASRDPVLALLGQLDGERRARRHRIVVRVTRARHQRRGVGGRVEEGAGRIVPEVPFTRVGERERLRQPRRVERQLIHREKADTERRVILEEAANAGLAASVDAERTTVAHQRAGKELSGAQRERTPARVTEYPRALGHAAQHQAIPRGDDLLVAGGTHAPGTRCEERGAAAVDHGSQRRRVKGARCGEDVH